MKFLKWGILVLAAMTWLSCVVSLLPLFDDGYLVSEPGLLGTWKVVDGADTWTFEKAEGMEYLLTQRQAEYDLEKSRSQKRSPAIRCVSEPGSAGWGRAFSSTLFQRKKTIPWSTTTCTTRT